MERRFRAISEIIAFLAVIAVTIAAVVFVVSSVYKQVGTYTTSPTRLQIQDIDVDIVSRTAVRVSILLLNPSDERYTVRVLDAVLYTGGFGSSSTLTIASSVARYSVEPGGSVLVELVLTGTLSDGVIRIRYQASCSLGAYSDVVLIPLKVTP